MEFAASKIFWLLIAPANLIGICIAMAFICRICKWWRGFDVFFITGCLLFFIFGIIPTGPSLLAMLESKHQRPEKMPDDIKGIIILGGAFDTYLSNIYGVPVLNDGVERVLDGITLAEKYPEATLWFSGGSGRLTHRERTEAMDAKIFLQSYPDLQDRTKFEDLSRNTWQNAVAMRRLVTLEPNDKWIVVTSAYHMPRAANMFWAAGWSGLVFWPTDYRTKGTPDFMPHKLDILGNLYQSHLAIREIIGQCIFNIRAKYKL